ncbi:MAG TPA: hypothetical protein DCQ94_22095, partial [Nitrospira sp.]|nr:hypothetical protein [Nitrospira sp.]
MTLRSSTFNILLFSADSEVQAHYKDLFGEPSITISREGFTLPKDFAKRGYDAVIVESRTTTSPDVAKLLAGIDPAHTLLIVGSRAVLKQAASSLHAAKTTKSEVPLSNGKGQS